MRVTVDRGTPTRRLMAHAVARVRRQARIAVICAASAAHRGEAFLACQELIDRLKARVPIWKREHGADGPHWLDWQDVRSGA